MRLFSRFFGKNNQNLRKVDEVKRKTKFVANSYNHLRPEIKPRQSLIISSKGIREEGRLKYFFIRHYRPLLLCLFIIILSIGFNIVNNSGFFNVREVVIVSEDQLIIDYLRSRLVGNNIFTINARQVEVDFENSFDRIGDVYVRKILPDQIEVDFKIETPELLLANYSGEFVLNERNEVLFKSNEFAQNLVVTKEEVEILIGFENTETDQIREIYKESLQSDEDRKNFVWDEVLQEEKFSIFLGLKNNLESRWNEQGLVLQRYVVDSYGKIPIVVFLEQQEYELGNSIDRRGRIEFSRSLYQFFLEIKVDNLILTWLTPATLRVDIIDDGRVFYFSSVRDFDAQLKDIDVANKNGLLGSGRIFDFRTNTYSIRQ